MGENFTAMKENNNNNLACKLCVCAAILFACKEDSIGMRVTFEDKIYSHTNIDIKSSRDCFLRNTFVTVILAVARFANLLLILQEAQTALWPVANISSTFHLAHTSVKLS